jgi:hypothetical protein
MNIRDKIWGAGTKATQEEVIELTNQFYVTLRAYFTRIKRDGENNVRNEEAFNRIKALLELETPDGKPVQNWTNAYEIEQLLVQLFDDDTVASELAIRVLEAQSILRTELAKMYESHSNDIENPRAGQPGANATAAPARRRTLLARLINDLQWRYIVNEATRRYSKLITARTALLSLIALTFFIGAIVVIATKRLTFHYGDLHLLWIAGLAGTWGATFSMLATLKSRLEKSKFDDLKSMKTGSVLLSRAAIGAGAACILFFFLLSGLLGGSAFPSLARPRDEPRQATAASATASTDTPTATPQQGTSVPANPATLEPTDLALLIVWCFIAGFSEQLIPGLLASTEARAGSQAPPTTDRHLPTTGTTQVASESTQQTTAASVQTPATQSQAPGSKTEPGT